MVAVDCLNVDQFKFLFIGTTRFLDSGRAWPTVYPGPNHRRHAGALLVRQQRYLLIIRCFSLLLFRAGRAARGFAMTHPMGRGHRIRAPRVDALGDCVYDNHVADHHRLPDPFELLARAANATKDQKNQNENVLHGVFLLQEKCFVRSILVLVTRKCR
jgi:hypothetical protein